MKATSPQITIARKSGSAALLQRMAGLTKLAAYVGVPAANSKDRNSKLRQLSETSHIKETEDESALDARKQQLTAMAGKTNSKKKAAKLRKAALSDVTNAELLFIHTNGSPINHIPARPVLQPAVEADGNKQAIAYEIAASVKANLAGDKKLAEKKMLRAALAGQNAARKWFTDDRNAWAPNKPATIARKGSDRPLIDTGALRASIVGVVREE